MPLLAEAPAETNANATVECENEFDRSTVAELSDTAIRDMSPDEMVQAVRITRVPHFVDFRRLRYMDRPTLQRMTFLARHCVRNQRY